MATIYEKALTKHEEWKGKISTELKMPLETRDDLSVAYTPGVAEPCRQIHKNPDDVYKKGGVYKDIIDASARSLNIEKIARTVTPQEQTSDPTKEA